MICTFTGWVEAYPTKTEKAKEVAWFLLRDIIPRFGFPLSIESDNGPTFVAEFLQLVCKAVNVKWKLHTVYRSQSSRMVERMNWTIRVTLAKWVQETGAPSWMDVMPLVLMRIRITPRAWLFLLWDNVQETSPTYLGSKEKFITKRRDGGVVAIGTVEKGDPWHHLLC